MTQGGPWGWVRNMTMVATDTTIQLHDLEERFGLQHDETYEKAVKVGEMFETGRQYYCREIFNILEKKYRKASWSNLKWYSHCNRIFNTLCYYEIFKYHNGFYTKC